MSVLLSYAFLFIAAMILICAIAGLLKFLLRFFFRKTRFLVCMLAALCVVAGLLMGIGGNPVSDGEDKSLIKQAVDEFGGVYSSKTPFVAWKFKESDEPAYADDGTETVKIDVSYLPVGSAQIEYDPEHGKFRLSKPLEISFLNGLTEGEGVDFDPDALADDISGALDDIELPEFSFDNIKKNASNALKDLADKID